jgi:hypothetical protein
MAGLTLSVGLTVTWALRALLRLRAYLVGSSARRGSACGPCCRSEACGEKSVKGGEVVWARSEDRTAPVGALR